jgi:hypothetical protein
VGVFDFFSKHGKTRPASPDLKTISYRGGIVSFRVPAQWREEYEPDGGGTFYEDRPDSGTLRVNVLTAASRSVEQAEETARRVFPAGSFELLPDGFPLRRQTVPAEERGIPIQLHRWEIAVPVPPNSIRIVCFTHTVVAAQESNPRIIAELSLLDRSIREAEFSREPGISGPYEHDRNA